MKVKNLIALVLIMGFTSNVHAIKPPKDVNVVNTPLVTVTNPQTNVTIDNTSPIPVSVHSQATDCSAPQFVGFTSAALDGAQGIVNYTNACQQDYPGSRMCTSVEFMNTVEFPATISGTGWIRPIFVAAETGAIDASGLRNDSTTTDNLSCAGWFMTTGFGLAVTAKGGFRGIACSNSVPVACCAKPQ